MRLVVKDPVDLQSLFAERSFRDGFIAGPAIRIALGSIVVAAVVLTISGSTDWPDPLQFLATATGLMLAQALVDNVSSRRSAQHTSKGPVASPGLGEGIPDTEQRLRISCPGGRAECSVSGTVEGLLSIAEDTFGLEGSQTANVLARRACELGEADGAWLYRMGEGSDRVILLSSHLQPQVSHDWEALSVKARHLAEGCVHSLCRVGGRAAQRPQLSRIGDYLAVPLARGNRVLGVLVVHWAGGAATVSNLKAGLLLSLASQATLTLENSLLYQTQLDVEAKLRQFALHRADYAATLSHELRTPLTSIKGFAQLLAREPGASAETVHQYADTITAEADKLALIVNDIVDLTRMETGLLQMRRKPVALGRLIRDAVARMQALAPDQQLRTSIPERLPLVRVDPERLDQVMGRLLVDAISQSIPQGGLLLAVEAGEEGVTVRLEYRTTEAQVGSLVRALKGPGQFADDGQATQLGRGGLGLYICRNFIEAHGGKMWIEEPEEQVARVVFTLPY